MRKFVVLFAALAALFVVPSVAGAAPASVFDGAVSCTTQGPGPNEGQTWCGTGQHNPQPVNTRSTVKSFDGVPIDVNFALPNPTNSQWGEGPYPLVYMFHGYGGGKINFPGMQHWLSKGYAVFSQSNRGFHESCGTANAKAADPVCATKGYLRLDDTRYEVRDAQTFAGMLVDEGLVQPTKIASTGGSYGGGMSMALAALKDRIMLPDGKYAPWKSPDGTPMSLAVSVPDIPWTDLAYSLVPNGSNVDYIKDASYHGRFGVMKQSYVNGLYTSGLLAPAYYAPKGQDPSADLTGWKAFMDAGEPYDSKSGAKQMLDEITAHHSSYYIDHSQPPAPLFISSGFTDDLFPANEATRYYNRTRAQYPNTPIGLFFGSFGHMRGQNGSDVGAAKDALDDQWVDYYLAGTGAKPASDVTTFTQVCPDGDPDGGPFVTKDWASQSPGEIRLRSAASQTVSPGGGDRASGNAFNPTSAPPAGKACSEAPGAQEAGTANYELAPAPAGGFTVMGSPTVVAKIQVAGENSQLAARLVDVSPDGSVKTLVNRALWRPENSGRQVFQLNPNGWTVKEGHVLRLELLPYDGGADKSALLSNFGRPSDGQQPVTVSDMDLRVPVKDSPGSLAGLVTKPAPRVLPARPGAALARGNEQIGAVTLAAYQNGTVTRVGRVTVKGRQLTARFRCAAPQTGAARCAPVKVLFKGAPKGKKAKGRNVKLAAGTVRVKAGKTATVKLKLTNAARKLFRESKRKIRKRGKVKIKRVKGLKSLRAKVTIGGRNAGHVTVKRTGRVR